jgi:ankyrin repeat protein
MQTFEAFPNFRFDTGVVRRQYLEDFGTQYSDEYNLQRHVNMVDDQGNTLLLIAVQNGHEKIPKFLLEKGANPNHQNNQGQTALHYAMTYGFYELGSWLVDSVEGAACTDTLLNKYGLGPYDGLTSE